MEAGSNESVSLARPLGRPDSTYCSAGAMLRKSTQIDSHFEVERPE
jgi:hypothetical protein